MTRPDTQPVVPKLKNRPPLRAMVNSWGCLLGAVMLAIGMAIGLFVALLVAPQLFGFDATATALSEEAIQLAATEADLDFRGREADQRETQAARDYFATEVRLDNEADLIGQTATQSERNLIATATAEAAESARQRTQIALDYRATQAQLEQDATQVQLDFENTQAALEDD